ncbi:MAG TPA: hypothetical protein VK025_15925 [Steroidobacter sp.]|jgi:hypothetical protein|nr:hypothetical protein [Steroidobacteraceae bacterium]HLS82889.1 hypothetical protein [Steroidobacter sp.]
MSEQNLSGGPTPGLRLGDPVKLKESGVDLRGDVWRLCAGRYVVVRWADDCRTTHCEHALEYDNSRGRADWARHLAHEDRCE